MNDAIVWMDRRARSLLPAATALLLFMLSLLPWGAGQITMPALVLMAVVYWASRAPALFPLPLIFAIGLALDLTQQTPLGAQALFLIAVTLVLQRTRRLDQQPFVWMWGAYAVATLAEALYLWMVVVLTRHTALPFLSLILRAVISIATFPIVARLLFHPVERLLSSDTK